MTDSPADDQARADTYRQIWADLAAAAKQGESEVTGVLKRYMAESPEYLADCLSGTIHNQLRNR
jgi:hypothetical protein